MTPLHVACTHGSTEIVAMLIKKGAAIRCKDEQDNTPLHLACLEGHTEIVKLLFSAGEDQNVLGEVSAKDLQKRGRVRGGRGFVQVEVEHGLLSILLSTAIFYRNCNYLYIQYIIQ